ncbi:MAG: helix-turn-helix transcriptional regulator [Actinomycetia bacterium]|nr:helix-turn-helix transcriptional regulator [Actinomycetes bacterium]
MAETNKIGDERDEQLLAARLKAAREFLGLSQEAVAKWMGIPRASVSVIESGKRRVSAVELARFSTLYRVSVGDLLSPNPETAADDETIAALFRTTRALPDEDRQQVLQFARFLKAGATQEPESRD